MEKFSDKNILITGASKGLGLVCARYFAEKGARLVMTARTHEQLERLRRELHDSNRHLAVSGDLIEQDEVLSVVNKTISFFNDKIDVIIHCLGGGYGFHDPLLSWTKMNTLYKLNVASAAEINRHLLPYMIKQEEGNVIHVCSIASSEATGSVGYNTVKAALAGYVRSLGREVAGSGVVVTGILPGAFYAPENAWRRLEERKPEAVKNFIQEKLPRKRIADADEILPLIALLAGKDASMMAGSCVPVDAGEGKGYVHT